MTITINQQVISPEHAPFIIAEAGINHNGDLELAKQMVDVAKQAGVSAVKFQTFKAEEFCGDPKQMFTYKSQGQEVTEPMLEMFKRMEFSREQWFELKHYCDQQGICFLSTPQNISDLDLLLEIGIDAIKVGSDDFSNIPLLKHYAAKGKTLIMSCGMADLADVYLALEAVNAFSGTPIILCLCTSQYPTPPTDINLEKLRTLKNAFPFLTLGFSDHSQGELASSLAVAYGACLFEKHFTISHDLPGPDHWFSENPESLKKWVDAINTAYVMKGCGIVRPTNKELEMRTLARRSIVALADIKQGETFNETNVGLRRPGNGLPPIMFEKVLGKSAGKDIAQSSLIELGDIND